MSLGVIIKAPEGVVLAAESRVTLTAKDSNGATIHVNFDNATKLLSFSEPYNDIGVITFGQAAIGFRTAQTFIPEFETKLPPVTGTQRKRTLTVLQFAEQLSTFFLQQWALVMPPAASYPGQDMTFNVSGFDDNEPYGKIYAFNIPRAPQPIEQIPPVNNQPQFGINWGGQREIVDRLVLGYDSRIFELLIARGIIQQDQIANVAPILQPLQLSMPIQFMPLQDCVNLATLFIRTTINAQNLSVGLRGCGGVIDVAIIKRNEPLRFIQKKEITVQ